MKRHLILLSFAFVGALSWGQSPQASDDTIAGQLFPPELVMQYHQEINLTAEQSKSVRDEIQKAQAKFLDMQWGGLGQVGPAGQAPLIERDV